MKICSNDPKLTRVTSYFIKDGKFTQKIWYKKRMIKCELQRIHN